MKDVERLYKIPRGSLTIRSYDWLVNEAKCVAQYVCYNKLKMTQKDIGDAFLVSKSCVCYNLSKLDKIIAKKDKGVAWALRNLPNRR